MTAIADAKLQRLLGVAMSAHELWSNRRYKVDAEAYERDMGNFIAALNERLEGAERMADALRWIGQGGNTIEASQDYVAVLESTAKAALAAYRQSKERTP